jgi:hypothetical protein
VYTVEKYKEKKLCYIAAELLNHERALRAIKATWIYSWKKKNSSSGGGSGVEEKGDGVSFSLTWSSSSSAEFLIFLFKENLFLFSDPKCFN